MKRIESDTLYLEELEDWLDRLVPKRLFFLNNQFVCQTDRPSLNLYSIRSRESDSLACIDTRLSSGRDKPATNSPNLKIKEVSYVLLYRN